MNDFLATTISGLIGVLIGTWISVRFSGQTQRAAFTFDFHREFNSSEMGRHRGKADALIISYPSLDFSELGKVVNNDSCDSLYLIMRYYQRLWLAIKYNHINKNLVLDMFTNNFYFWYYISFEKNFIHLDWSGCPHMLSLANWFYENVEHDRHIHLRDKYRTQLMERVNAAALKATFPTM